MSMSDLIPDRFKRKPKFDFTDDVDRQTPPKTDKQVTAGALANLIIRFLFLHFPVLKRLVRRVERVTARAKKRHARLVTHRARWTKKLSDAKWVKRMAAVRAHQATETEIGHLMPWVLSLVLLVLKVTMIVIEPPFVYTTIRVAQDVPASVGLWSGDPRVVLAAAAGVLMAGLLLALTVAAARGIALTMFHTLPKGGKASQESPEYGAWTRSVLLLPRWQRRALTGIAVAFLAVVTVFLHTFADSRVTGTSFNSTADASSTALVVLITFLPWLVVGIGVIAEHPVLHHVAQVRRWAFGFTVKELVSVRWEAWRMTLYRRSRRIAQRGALRLADAADRLGLRADAEYTGASITLGTPAPDVSAYTGRAKGLDAIDGKAAIAMSKDNLPLSHELTEVTKQAKSLPDVAEIPELIETWNRFKADEPLTSQTDDTEPPTDQEMDTSHPGPSKSASPNSYDEVVNLSDPQPADITAEEGKT